MREVHSIEFESEELAVIKTALLQFNKRSSHYEKAQQLASQILVTPIHHDVSNWQEGLTEDIIQALLELKKPVTAPEIEKHLGLPRPNSVVSICSRLAKQCVIGRVAAEPIKGQHGLSAKWKYFVKD